MDPWVFTYYHTETLQQKTRAFTKTLLDRHIYPLPLRSWVSTNTSSACFAYNLPVTQWKRKQPRATATCGPGGKASLETNKHSRSHAHLRTVCSSTNLHVYELWEEARQRTHAGGQQENTQNSLDIVAMRQQCSPLGHHAAKDRTSGLTMCSINHYRSEFLIYWLAILAEALH